MWLRKSKKKKLPPELEYGFTDLDKKKYYRIPAQLALPIERYGKLQENLMWQSAGMTATEIKSLLALAETELENLVQGHKGALSKVGFIIQEMKMRSEVVLHTELLYQFIAILYIREDEDMNHYNESIQQEKVDAFKRIVAEGGAYEFFQLPELSRVNQLLNLSQQEWEELWMNSIREQDRLKRTIEYLKSGIKSAKEKKTSVTN